MKTLKNKKGFTLMEMLIVVAIIAVLVAIALPVYNDRLHKVRVAADWANVRAYYAEIQLDYLTSGEHNNNVPDINSTQAIPGIPGAASHPFDIVTIPFLSGAEVKLQAGTYCVVWETDGSYSISYSCKDNHTDHNLVLQ